MRTICLNGLINPTCKNPIIAYLNFNFGTEKSFIIPICEQHIIKYEHVARVTFEDYQNFHKFLDAQELIES